MVTLLKHLFGDPWIQIAYNVARYVLRDGSPAWSPDPTQSHYLLNSVFCVVKDDKFKLKLCCCLGDAYFAGHHNSTSKSAIVIEYSINRDEIYDVIHAIMNRKSESYSEGCVTYCCEIINKLFRIFDIQQHVTIKEIRGFDQLIGYSEDPNVTYEKQRNSEIETIVKHVTEFPDDQKKPLFRFETKYRCSIIKD